MDSYFEGQRKKDGCVIYYNFKDPSDNMDTQVVPLYTNIINHSPTGYEFGYSGSGPAQAAFAILFHFTKNKELSLSLYQKFKFWFIANIKEDTWILDCNILKMWIMQESINEQKTA
jgi:hypothetical protein